MGSKFKRVQVPVVIVEQSIAAFVHDEIIGLGKPHRLDGRRGLHAVIA